MKISKEKQDKIKEGILSFLFHNSPHSFFTSEISKELARDEEFMKKLLEEMLKQGLVAEVKKNQKGREYTARTKWRISAKIYETYKKLQNKGIEVY
ncbi:hypothetical protein J4433_02720 [Candidatus Pacearchaeota archaeon]|nr:hypothetical protein [Candidatus Pacearchaeota archaeon]